MPAPSYFEQIPAVLFAFAAHRVWGYLQSCPQVTPESIGDEHIQGNYQCQRAQSGKGIVLYQMQGKMPAPAERQAEVQDHHTPGGRTSHGRYDENAERHARQASWETGKGPHIRSHTREKDHPGARLLKPAFNRLHLLFFNVKYGQQAQVQPAPAL